MEQNTEQEIYYSPTPKKTSFRLSKHELLHLLIAWLGITLAFSWKGFIGFPKMYAFLPVVLIGTLTGFILHELAHKFVAIHYEANARFFLWPAGLGFAIILSLITSGGFVFAAPGAVYIWGKDISRKENGIISLAGPLTNLLLAIICIFVGLVLVGFAVKGLALSILFGAAMINLFLGGFNLLPIPPLDGFKVFVWNKTLWAITLLTIIGLFILLNLL